MLTKVWLSVCCVIVFVCLSWLFVRCMSRVCFCSFVCLSVRLFVCLSVFLSVCLTVCLSIWLFA